mgnify:CR=1
MWAYFDFLRLKIQSNNNEEIENYLDLEREYLTSNQKDNIYGFQKSLYGINYIELL